MAVVRDIIRIPRRPLRHSVADGMVTIHGNQGTESDACALAWGILSDLDPDEADAVRNEKAEARRQLIRSRMLAVLVIGRCTAQQLKTITGASGYEIAGILKPLRMTGVVDRVDSGGPRDRAVWAITDKGRGLSPPSGPHGRGLV